MVNISMPNTGAESYTLVWNNIRIESSEVCVQIIFAHVLVTITNLIKF